MRRLRYPQNRHILTSGGQKSAIDGAERLPSLVQLTKHTQLSILAGSGLTVDNARSLAAMTGVSEIHVGTGVRENGQALKYVDEQKVQALRSVFAG